MTIPTTGRVSKSLLNYYLDIDGWSISVCNNDKLFVCTLQCHFKLTHVTLLGSSSKVDIIKCLWLYSTLGTLGPYICSSLG